MTIAAVTFSTYNPIAASDMDRARAAAAALGELREAINGFEPTLKPTSFQQNTVTLTNANGANPLRISDLTNKISSASGTANSLNSCGQLYSSNEVTAWSSSGPFWGGVVTASGAKLADGFVAQDLMVATPADPANFGSGLGNNLAQYLGIRMPSVELLDAQNLSQVVDGDVTGSGTIRSIRFTASGTAPISVDYIVMIDGC